MKVLGKKLSLVLSKPDNITPSGILLATNTKVNIGVVNCTGKGVNDVNVGDKVMFSKLCGKEIGDNVLIEYNDIQCKIVDDKLLPVDDNIIVKQDTANTVTESGIIINIDGDIDHVKPNVGEVISVGNKNVKYKIGDRIAFNMYSGRKMEYNGEKFILMKSNEPYFIIMGGVDVEVIDNINDIENLAINLDL
jgi:co-chaperonin GroES (HSP10)